MLTQCLEITTNQKEILKKVISNFYQFALASPAMWSTCWFIWSRNPITDHCTSMSRGVSPPASAGSTGLWSISCRHFLGDWRSGNSVCLDSVPGSSGSTLTGLSLSLACQHLLIWPLGPSFGCGFLPFCEVSFSFSLPAGCFSSWAGRQWVSPTSIAFSSGWGTYNLFLGHPLSCSETAPYLALFKSGTFGFIPQRPQIPHCHWNFSVLLFICAVFFILPLTFVSWVWRPFQLWINTFRFSSVTSPYKWFRLNPFLSK